MLKYYNNLFENQIKMLSSFNNDPARVQKRLEESVYPGLRQLNTPGPGNQLPFWEDPHIRLQKWGGNLMMDTVNLESDLKGMTRNAFRGDVMEYSRHRVPPQQVAYPVSTPFVSETRASQPAWQFREVDVANRHWDYPILNPQSVGIFHPFQRDLQTRILVKDAEQLRDYGFVPA